MLDYKTIEDDTLSILSEVKILQHCDLPDDKRVLILDHIVFLSDMILQQVRLSLSIMRENISL